STTAPAPIVAPGPMTRGGGASRTAFERTPRASGLPSTAPSCTRAPSPTTVPAWITTLPPSSTSSGSVTSSPSSSPGARSDGCSTRAPLEGLLERLQHAHHAQPALAAGSRLGAVSHPIYEVPALDP